MIENTQKLTNNNISKMLLVKMKVKKQMNYTIPAECITDGVKKAVELVNTQAKEGQVARVIEFDRMTK